MNLFIEMVCWQNMFCQISTNNCSIILRFRIPVKSAKWCYFWGGAICLAKDIMSKFLNSVALLPMLGFIVTMIYTIVVKEETFSNYHWFIVALISLSASSERLKHANTVAVTIFVSSILSNILLLVASSVDLKITSFTFILFLGYLSIGFLILMANLAFIRYKKNETIINS